MGPTVPEGTRTGIMKGGGIALFAASAVLLFLILVPLGVPQETLEAETLPEPPNAYKETVITARAAIVYDLSTGRVLYEQNADAQLPLASLTKILAVEAALHALPVDLPITISSEDTAVPSPKRFKAGDTLTLTDLARLTLTASLNDGASAIVRTLASRAATTTTAVLKTAISTLGLASTYAMNGSGLDLSGVVAGAYGSARDMARLAGALVKDAPSIAHSTTLSMASASTLAGKSYQIHNTNPTVENAPRLLLSKTGYTELAGGNLVVVFDAAINHPVAVVVLGSTEDARFTDATALTAATLAYFAGIESP